ncbi:MAG: enterochelin esterase, partial [Gammaproteobacteria bacterium]
IAYRIQNHWQELKSDLDGKIHIFVGTADTFYLDGAAHKLKAVLDALGAKSSIQFLPGKTHFDLYAKGKDRGWLSRKIAWEMYAVARPHSDLKPPKPVTDQ